MYTRHRIPARRKASTQTRNTFVRTNGALVYPNGIPAHITNRGTAFHRCWAGKVLVCDFEGLNDLFEVGPRYEIHDHGPAVAELNQVENRDDIPVAKPAENSSLVSHPSPSVLGHLGDIGVQQLDGDFALKTGARVLLG